MEKIPNQADEELLEKYDIVFIGGGPATLSFFSFICRNKNFENFFTSLNILIIEKSESFGSGCLGKYGINSNTSAEGFVRLICFNDDENGKEEKQNLSPNKKKPNGENSKSNFFNGAAANSNSNTKTNTNNSNNSNKNDSNNNSSMNFSNSVIFKKFKNKCVPIFEDLLHSNETKNLLSIGSKIAPLTMIGSFLDCVGNSIASYIYSKFNKRIFMNYCEVTKINVDYEKCFESNSLKISEVKNSGIFPYEIFVEKIISSSNNQNKNLNNNSKVNSDFKKQFKVKSKIVIMASGAQQKFDSKQKQEILRLVSPSDFFHSDYVLQETGYNHLISYLTLKEKKRVVIIGGSHSGFSCAWMLINSYIDIHKLKEQNKSIRAQSALNNSCATNNKNNNGSFYKFKTNPNCLECKTVSCCFGSAVERAWSKPQIAALPHGNCLENLEIVILYRDHIKVYYHSEREALDDGYNVYDQSKAVNKNGNVYPFIGIRGDAKELYRRIVTGKEKRVKLQKANSFNEQKNFIAKANAIIWACGYTTQKMTFLDANCKSKQIEFYLDANNQFDVDKDLHVLNTKKAPFFNLFGIGQGYSTHSIELLGDGKFARADSVNLYNTYISKKLFKALDFIFNFTCENASNNDNTGKEKEKENMKKTGFNSGKPLNSQINNSNNNNNLKQMQGNNNSSIGDKNNHTNNKKNNNNNNENKENVFNKTNKKNGDKSATASSKKIIQLIPNDASNLRNSTNNANNNFNGNIHSNSLIKAKNSSNSIINSHSNIAASSSLLKKTNGQSFFNSPNIKTVKMITNNLASLSVPSNPNLNATSDGKKLGLSKNSVLQSNLNSINNDNGVLRASQSRGLDQLASISKTKFYKNNNNESNFESTFNNNLNNNKINNNDINKNSYGNSNFNNEISPPSRNIKSRSPVNVHANETAGVNLNYPSKRENSRLKALQSIANMNFSNSNNNNYQNALVNTKTNAISKNFANLNGGVNNNNNNLNEKNKFANSGTKYFYIVNK